MGKKTENKNAKSPKSSDKIRLLEETAYKNIQTKKGDDRTAIWIKNKHLAYEIELKKLQIELMKLQSSLKVNGERFLAIFEGRDAAGGKAAPLSGLLPILIPGRPESSP